MLAIAASRHKYDFSFDFAISSFAIQLANQHTEVVVSLSG